MRLKGKKRGARRSTRQDGHAEPRGIAAAYSHNHFQLFYQVGSLIRMGKSKDGTKFSEVPKKISAFPLPANRRISLSALPNGGALIYAKMGKGRIVPHLAFSRNLSLWKEMGRLPPRIRDGGIATDFSRGRRFLLYYYSKKEIRLAVSRNLATWEFIEPEAFPLRQTAAGTRIRVELAAATPKGIVVLYGAFSGNALRSMHALLFNKTNPQELLWKSPQAIWENVSPAEPQHKFFGVALSKHALMLYWNSPSGIVVRSFPRFYEWIGSSKLLSPQLVKHEKNPIVRPSPEQPWESRATFNPGALYEGGKVHLLYRAIGEADRSVLGYAASANGLEFNERFPSPVYEDEYLSENSFSAPFASPFASGGGCVGGCEDPRLTRLGDTVYMTYVAYDGASPPRVALTSISIKNFLERRWRWKQPVFISPKGVVNKNACILPEKIGGKYVVFHRVFPNILIDFVDSLDFDGKTKWLAGHHKISPRRGFWDSRKIGVGAPPIKTKEGWLLIYQAVGDEDAGRYKVGAMLLDLKNPAKVLYRSKRPVLEPTERYENEGHKSGVAYPCGAVVIGPDLFVYYGGADTVACVATARLDEFLHALKTTDGATLGKPVLIMNS